MGLFARPVPHDEAAIAGVVTDKNGKPLAWAAVLIARTSSAHQDIAAATNKEGQYRFDRLTPGGYTLLVNASGHAPCEGRVTARMGTLARLDFSIR